MHLIIYSSQYTGESRRVHVALSEIFSDAKSNNSEHDISGAVFYKDDQFVQLLEGKEEHLRLLLQHLENDVRHSNIKYLIDEPIDRRRFAEWGMGFCELDDDQVQHLKDIVRAGESDTLRDSMHERLVEQLDNFISFYHRE